MKRIRNDMMLRACYCALTEGRWINSGELSRYSDSLSPGWPRDRIPVRTRFSAPVLGSTQGYTSGNGSSSGVKRSRRGTDYAAHLVSKFNKEYCYTSTSPLSLHGLFQGELYLCPLFLSLQPVPEEECKCRIFQVLSTKELCPPIVSFVFAAYSLHSHHGIMLNIQPG
jgi:hypothetical protein